VYTISENMTDEYDATDHSHNSRAHGEMLSVIVIFMRIYVCSTINVNSWK